VLDRYLAEHLPTLRLPGQLVSSSGPTPSTQLPLTAYTSRAPGSYPLTVTSDIASKPHRLLVAPFKRRRFPLIQHRVLPSTSRMST